MDAGIWGIIEVAEGFKMDAAIWGIIGVVVGAASSIVMIARNSRRARTREFQRDNLILLQDRLLQLSALTIKYRTKSMGEKLVTLTASDEFILSSQSLTILTERIADESLRESVKHVNTALSWVIKNKDTNSDDASTNIIVKASNVASAEIGVILRSLY